MDSAQKSILNGHWQDRTELLLGEDAKQRLSQARVLVVGVGGVGGYAAEMLARTGVGKLTLLDSDNVDVTNINRQLIALHSTIGKSKVELFANRFRDISPDIIVVPRELYLTPDNVSAILDEGYDYVIDAIDTVAPKVALISECHNRKIPIISSMGAGGRTDPAKVCITDIWNTSEDGLARAVRQRLKKRGLKIPLKVVCSREAPKKSSLINLNQENKLSSFGTIATIPAIFGIMLASEVIRKLTHTS